MPTKQQELADLEWLGQFGQGATGPGSPGRAGSFLANATGSIARGLGGIATLGPRAVEAAGSLFRGGSYDPEAPVGMALMTMGGTAFGAPRGAVGAGPSWVGKKITEMSDREFNAFIADLQAPPGKSIAGPKLGPKPTEEELIATGAAKSKAAYDAYAQKLAKMPSSVLTTKPGGYGPKSIESTPKYPELPSMRPGPPSSMADDLGELFSNWRAGGKSADQLDIGPLPREVPFGVPEKGQALGFNVPLVHGTRQIPHDVPFQSAWGSNMLSKDFGQFTLPETEIGIHFGSPRAAQHFTGDVREGAYPRKFPVVIKAQNPLEMKDIGTWTPEKIQQELNRLGFDRTEVSAARYASPKHIDDAEKQIQGLRDYITGKGYDSIKYTNRVEDPGHTSYILMNPAQARVPWAAFDPAKVGSPDLLSGLAGLGVAGAGVRQVYQEENK